MNGHQWVTFWELGPWNRPGGWAMMVLAVHVLVLMLMLAHAMQQAAMAMVRKLLRKGGLIQRTARA